MHKKRIRKKISRRLKANAIKLEALNGAINIAKTVIGASTCGLLFMKVAGVSACHSAIGMTQRMAATPAEFFYRRHYGYPDIQPKCEVVNLSVNRGSGDVAYNLSCDELRVHLDEIKGGAS